MYKEFIEQAHQSRKNVYHFVRSFFCCTLLFFHVRYCFTEHRFVRAHFNYRTFELWPDVVVLFFSSFVSVVKISKAKPVRDSVVCRLIFYHCDNNVRVWLPPRGIYLEYCLCVRIILLLFVCLSYPHSIGMCVTSSTSFIVVHHPPWPRTHH